MIKPKSKEALELITYLESIYVLAKLEDKTPYFYIKKELTKNRDFHYYDVTFRLDERVWSSRDIRLEILEDRNGNFEQIKLNFRSTKRVDKLVKRLRKIKVYSYQITENNYNYTFNIQTLEQMKTILSWYDKILEEF